MRFRTDDMTCQGCVRAIAGAVAALDPAARVTADLAAHTVEVATDRPREQVAAAIAAAGFRLQPAD